MKLVSILHIDDNANLLFSKIPITILPRSSDYYAERKDFVNTTKSETWVLIIFLDWYGTWYSTLESESKWKL